MTVKELAYAAQQHLQSKMGTSYKRAHVYELLAASFGFKSFAALSACAVFTSQHGAQPRRNVSQGAHVKRRHIELGYPPEAADKCEACLRSFLEAREIGIMLVSELIRELRGNWGSSGLHWRDDDTRSLEREDLDNDSEPFDPKADASPLGQWCPGDGVDGLSPLLLDSLEAAAAKGQARAHYALALIFAPSAPEDRPPSSSRAYWHSQAQQGRVLTGVEKEWADAYSASIANAEKAERHLREAADLGSTEARLEMAARYGDTAFFEAQAQEVDADPASIAEIAEHLGRWEDAKHWFTVAASQGNVEAMRSLVERSGPEDLVTSWTWIYFSQLLGEDISQDDYHAIQEDGSPYDDDVGGPAFVGGRDGVDLDALDTEQDAAARQAAQRLCDQLKVARSAGRKG